MTIGRSWFVQETPELSTVNQHNRHIMQFWPSNLSQGALLKTRSHPHSSSLIITQDSQRCLPAASTLDWVYLWGTCITALTWMSQLRSAESWCEPNRICQEECVCIINKVFTTYYWAFLPEPPVIEHMNPHQMAEPCLIPGVLLDKALLGNRLLLISHFFLPSLLRTMHY